jgi:hypothetical protein
MIPIVEDSILGSDLNCQFYDLLNCNALVPVPPGLIESDDPRLTDARAPIPGSVTNASVAAAAGIVQSKLNLNGQIPPAWLGTTATTAATGSLAEYISHKGQANGYCELDGSGKVPAARLPGTVGTGTVTSVGLSMPAQFTVTGSPVTAAGTLSAAWTPAADLSWFGNKSGASAAPQFYTTALPAALIPSLDAAKVISGVFPAARLPVAVGLGVSHAAGAVPDPGDGSGGALATDYLARDMTYKAAPTVTVLYQPTLPNPTFTPSAVPGYPKTVAISCSVTDATIFYSLTAGGASGFQELPPVGYISVPSAMTLYAYAAHPGYSNSSVVSIAI